MPVSPAGRGYAVAFASILFVDLVVLGLSASVNAFQDFFFMADIFPLAMSVITLVLLVMIIVLDLSFHNSFTSRPPFLIGVFSVLSILWLAFNAFSTSRWDEIPLSCGDIPSEFSDEQGWCRDLQTLKAFIWVEWVLLFVTLLYILRHALVQQARGQRHVWNVALSQYAPQERAHVSDGASSFLQWG